MTEEGEETTMKRFRRISWLVLMLLFAGAGAGYAEHGGHGGHGGGVEHGGHGGHEGRHGGHFGLDVLIGPEWWGPAYPYYEEPPVVIQQQEPEIYEAPAEPSYWYYCRNPQGYYPYVKQCPNGWMKVVPSSPPGQ
jgi:hypothetical protein